MSRLFWKIPYALLFMTIFSIGILSGYFTWGRTAPIPVVATKRVHIAESFVKRRFMAEVRIGDVVEPFLIDTGAETVLITPALADKLHVIVLQETKSMGIGGEVESRRIKIPEMKIGDIVARNVDASIAASPVNLLGMPFLEQMGRIEIKDHVLTFEQ